MNEENDAEARRIWTELWEGKWTIADAKTDAGQRTLVLHRPRGPGLRRMSGKERYALALAVRGRPLKHIAFDLGLSVSTACYLVSCALKKVGLTKRLEVSQWLAFDGGDR